jgi:hypothetical protein
MIYSGRITKIDKALDGSPLFTVVNSGGAILYPCYLISSASGVKGVSVHAPMGIGASVCLIRSDTNLPCYIIGGFAHEDDQSTIKVTDPVTASEGEDYRGSHVDEYQAKVGSTSLTLSPRNDLVIDAPSMRLQLQGQSLRISQEGEAVNSILNAQPFLNTLFDYLGQLETQLRAVSVAANVPADGTITSTSDVVKSEAEGTVNPHINIP